MAHRGHCRAPKSDPDCDLNASMGRVKVDLIANRQAVWTFLPTILGSPTSLTLKLQLNPFQPTVRIPTGTPIVKFNADRITKKRIKPTNPPTGFRSTPGMENPPTSGSANATLISTELPTISHLIGLSSSPSIIELHLPRSSASTVYLPLPPQLTPEGKTRARYHLEISRERLNRQLQSFPSMPIPSKWREAVTEHQDTIAASKVYSYWRLRAEVPSSPPNTDMAITPSPCLDPSEPVVDNENVFLDDTALRPESRAQTERRIAKHERKRHEINSRKQKTLRMQLRCMEAEEQIKFLQDWIKEVVVPPDWDAYWEGLEKDGEVEEETPVVSEAQTPKNGPKMDEHYNENMKEIKMKILCCLRMPGFLKRSLRAVKDYLVSNSRRRIQAVDHFGQKKEQAVVVAR